ncbi:MAG: DNA gyrase inhibitor YacG [Planctomycetes bacterium]|nr:DNA gyrase inhibitor YacG [Planctomycetota bacterium]
MRCPSCERRVDPKAETFPFCCTRCRQVDLYRWLSGDMGLEHLDDPDPDPESGAEP